MLVAYSVVVVPTCCLYGQLAVRAMRLASTKHTLPRGPEAISCLTKAHTKLKSPRQYGTSFATKVQSPHRTVGQIHIPIRS